MRRDENEADRRLKEWALAMEIPLHAVGYPPTSQMHRICVEGAEGMLASGPPTDGGLFAAMMHLRHHVEATQRVMQIAAIVHQMRKEYRDLVRETYLFRPGYRRPRRDAAEALGLKGQHYRDRLIFVHGYVQSVLDANGPVAQSAQSRI